VHAPRAQFSQPALYETGSALTLFQVSNNAEEFLAALNGKPFKAADVDAVSAAEFAVQAEEGIIRLRSPKTRKRGKLANDPAAIS
jgi:restriction system protein